MPKTVEMFKAADLKWLGHFFGFLHENKPAPFEPKHKDARMKTINAPNVYIIVHVMDDLVESSRHQSKGFCEIALPVKTCPAIDGTFQLKC